MAQTPFNMFNNSNHRDHSFVLSENKMHKPVAASAQPEPCSGDGLGSSTFPALFHPPTVHSEYTNDHDAAAEYESMDEYDIRPEDEDEALGFFGMNVDGEGEGDDENDEEKSRFFRPSRELIV